MLLVDDLLAAPLNGILWVFKEIHNAATEEQRSRRDQIMASLSALYVSLEQGEIDDATFDAQEQLLLDELDGLDGQDADADSDDDASNEDEHEHDQAVQVAKPDSDRPEYALKAIPETSAPDDAPAPKGGRKSKKTKGLKS